MPRRLRPLLYRQPRTVAWGPVPPPGQAPAPGETQCHRLALGRPRGLWAYRHSPARSGVRTLGPLQEGSRRGWYRRRPHHQPHLAVQ